MVAIEVARAGQGALARLGPSGRAELVACGLRGGGPGPERGPRAVNRRLWALRVAAELAGHSDRELASLLPYFDEVLVPAGRRLALQGRLANAYLIVLQGRLQARSAGGAVRYLGAGDSFGWEAMWERGENPETVVVAADA